ncbi:transcriptional regulator, TetR family [Arthrobacter sp. yr096]|uniref:TetR/AcrR family transcriptional regulator n=1 Tax=unclassified Arthrobacter TaxID=235627 RepID=UPI0008991E74|nr:MULTISPECIES: TetR/AcrR family transcriptional regulator [unclassified Arthrobacter]SDX20147.1 transcriptional regulator, TetR family [Arthrobacter sp. cf158]SEI44196.1 transcriptional regulator, TetR family [Arthrobacter sp. yr096]
MTTKDVGRAARRGPYAKSEERRRTILDAAHAVFAARGYRGGSLQEVADRVGLSQTSLLHYFPSKSELLMAVLKRRDEITSGSFPDDMEEGLVDSVIRTALFNEDIPGVIELYTVLCAESVTDGHPGREYFTERFERLRKSYARRFAELAAQGRLRPGIDPDEAAMSLVALWDGLQTQWLLAPDDVDVAKGLRGYFKLLVLPES